MQIVISFCDRVQEVTKGGGKEFLSGPNLISAC